MGTNPPQLRTPSEPAPASVDVNDVEAVYRAHSTACYYLALQIVRDAQLAQDVVQEVFAVVTRHPSRFEPTRGSLSTWLLTITHHKAVDAVRQSTRKTRLDVPVDQAADLVDTAASPELQAITNDEGGRVRTALAGLNRAEREVLVLAYFNGYTQREIAQHIAVPLGTVKSRTLSGLRRLHTELSSGSVQGVRHAAAR